MTAQAIIADIWAHGITLRLADDGRNLVAPAGKLTAEQRELILSHKPELIGYLQAAHVTTAALLAVAMRRCDEFGDAEAARQTMRDDCLALSHHLQADLLAHFDPKASKA